MWGLRHRKINRGSGPWSGNDLGRNIAGALEKLSQQIGLTHIYICRRLFRLGTIQELFTVVTNSCG